MKRDRFSCCWWFSAAPACGHDQHLITAISDANECSILPLGIQFRLSCTSRSNRHEVHSFSQFNQLSAVRLTSMQFMRCAPVTTNLIPRHQSPRVFHEKRQDGMSRRYFAFHALFQRTLHHSYLFLYFTHRHWGEPKGGRAKGGPLAGCVWRFNAKIKNALAGSAPMGVGGGTLLVPMWLLQLLMATIVRIISNSGSMAMVTKILSLMMTTILKYWPRTRNT